MGQKLIVDSGKEDGLAGVFEKIGFDHSDTAPEGKIQQIYTRKWHYTVSWVQRYCFIRFMISVKERHHGLGIGLATDGITRQ